MMRNEGFPPATRDDWRRLVEGDPKSPSVEKLRTPLEDGIVCEPLYSRIDREGAHGPGLPGSAPWIRGVHARPPEAGWEVVQTIDLPDPAEAGRQAAVETERGATSLLIRIGAEGVRVGSAGDLRAVLGSVPLERIPVALEAGEDWARTAGWLRELWAERGVSQARGNLGADPLGTMAASGRMPPSLDETWAEFARLARETSDHPHLRTARVSTAPYHEAGATGVQELAAALSTAVAYLRRLVEAGLSVDGAARKIAIEIQVGADVFWEIAKLRAMRWIWGRALRAAGSRIAPRIEAASSWRIMTVRDPWVNLLRTTAAAFAAAAGGAEGIRIRPFDSPLGVPDEFGRRLARNIQRILLDESQLHHVIDPAGGSYYVESLTEELARKAWAKFQELERQGGIEKALREGSLQREIAEADAEREALVARRKLPITGLSEFPNLAEELPARKPRPEVESSGEPTIEPLRRRRLGASFEKLRDASDAHLRSRGARPRIFMANLGKLAEYNARATWIRNLLAAGGVEAVGEAGFSSGAAAAEEFAKSGCSVAVICGADATYEILAEETARALREKGASHLLLAGWPGEMEARLREAGVDGFLFAGQDVIEALTSLLRTCGVEAAEANR